MKGNTMSRTTFENQSMLVVIGVGGLGYGIIAATKSEIIKHEVTQVSGMVEDHFGDASPTEFGLYVWEGSVTVEPGGWAGGEVIDPDTWWDGSFRKATQADLVGFGLLEPMLDTVIGPEKVTDDVAAAAAAERDTVVPCLIQVDPDTREATGVVAPFCAEACRHEAESSLDYPDHTEGVSTVADFGFDPKCEQCGTVITAGASCRDLVLGTQEGAAA
jgi:hypothetical protein